MKAGSEERLDVFITLAVSFRRQGYTYQQIAEKVADEMQLPRIPHFTTVMKWIRMGSDAVESDTVEMALQLRVDQFNDLERLKAKWMDVAAAKELVVRRQKIAQCEQILVEEKDLQDQARAAKVCIEIMNRQAKLMGLDLQGANDKNAQELSFASLQQMIIESHSVPNGTMDTACSTNPLLIARQVLEVGSGLDEKLTLDIGV